MATISDRWKSCTRWALPDTLPSTGKTAAFFIAGYFVATWPALAPGWPAFNLNIPQCRTSLHRMADVGAEIVCVGHGEPLPEDGSSHIRVLAEQL